jgi:hypothetical protein
MPPQLWRREEDQQDQTADRRRCLGLLLTVLATAAADDLHSFKGLTPQVGGAADLGVDHPQRTIRDYERPPGHHEIHAHWATILIMTRRLARPSIAAHPGAT